MEQRHVCAHTGEAGRLGLLESFLSLNAMFCNRGGPLLVLSLRVAIWVRVWPVDGAAIVVPRAVARGICEVDEQARAGLPGQLGGFLQGAKMSMTL